ncbi:hypothetical protein [Tautonia marina]|uniref:hypothetical protein n=1 Tax=Tautonia marina TaxID=2653855 RepID=UPI0012612740|nr:hypothetical protein [Tautonia marina]
MAIRIHVTALRDCAVEDVRSTFCDILGPGFEQVPIYESNGWAWFTTSVWGVGGSDLNKGLCRLARPALQFTTSDGDRWVLTIHGGPEGQQHFVHEFHLLSHPGDPDHDESYARELQSYQPEPIDPDLAFLEDDPEAEPVPVTPVDELTSDFADFGAPLPESLLDDLRGLPRSGVVNRLRDWLADAIPEAMAQAGLPVDAPNVRRVLLWENVTERERDGDLGNLPRLLSVLGLDGEWDDYVSQAEQPPEESCDLVEEEPGSPSPPTDHAQSVFDLVGSLPLTPIKGGPVPVPPVKIKRLGIASQACTTSSSSSPGIGIHLKLPENDPSLTLEPPRLRAPNPISWTRTDRGFAIGSLYRETFFKNNLVEHLGKPLTKLLAHPPEGTVEEIAFAVSDEPATYHRFRGTVRDGLLWIEESHPPLSHEVLLGALDSATYEPKYRVVCRDEDEARALEQAARQDDDLKDMGLKRHGATLSIEFDTGNLARLLLRLRSGNAWDFGPRDAKKAEERQQALDMMRQLRRSGAKMARERAAPHEAEVLFKGRHSWYWRSDFLQLDQLDPEPRATFDAAMTSLGFTLIGDLIAKKQRDIVLRVFLSNDRLSYAILMAKRTMYLGQEFVSRLADGSGLTTTTLSTVDSVPGAGIYYRIVAGLPLEGHYEKHLEGLERFRTRKGLEPVLLGGTLEDVAREIELAFDRHEAADR